eukprot:s4608_g6.t1
MFFVLTPSQLLYLFDLVLLESNILTMASSDRSRSPPGARSFPGFPVWRGPMGAAIRAAQSRPGTQMAQAFRPQCQSPSGPYHMWGPYPRAHGALSSTSMSTYSVPSHAMLRCDPLALPVAALLYQQADNFWLRKLAHGRELYLIPTGDIAAVVFGTELLSQLRNSGIDLDRVSHCFYGRPILLETEPDQEFLGFMIATEPFELIYCGPTDISQVLSPFSASPPKVLLSGFRFRCHIVAKGAHPLHRVHAGIQQLIDLYTLAGFEATDLNQISSQILASTA